jgi:FdhD protein
MQDRSSHRARVLRYGGDAGARVDDQLAAEEPLEIRIGGQPLTLMMRTPGHDRDLALGFLFGEGIIRSADEVSALTVVPNGEHPALENVIDVALASSAPGVDQRWSTQLPVRLELRAMRGEQHRVDPRGGAAASE